MIRQAAYRTRQFLRALTARLAVEDSTRARQLLTPAQWALFEQMSPADRRHALEVCRTLESRGAQPHDLLVAALLHDVGKATSSLWVRVTMVLFEWLAPGLAERFERGEPGGWRAALVAYRRHAARGAKWADRAGCSPLTVALIHRHDEPPGSMDDEESRLLSLLQEADGRW